MPTKKDKPGSVIALFGSAGEVGRALLSRLAANPRWKKIVCFDLIAPRRSFAHSTYYKIDLAEPTINTTILQAFEKEGVDTVVHAALTNDPSYDPEYLHEYECIGTLQVLAACAEVGIQKLVVQSTTMLYGASPTNPIYLSEQQPLRADKQYAYLKEKVDVENQVAQYRKSHQGASVTCFRFATLMGKGTDNFMARYLRRPLVQTVLGHDPLWQLLHIEDALSAIEVALDKDLPGVFNYAAPGVLPLSTIVQLLGGQRLPTPYSVFRTQMAVLRLGQLAGFPPQHLNYFRHGCLGDCTRAFKIAGLRPKYTLQDTLAASELSAVEWMEDQ